jgi:hypothetical protein
LRSDRGKRVVARRAELEAVGEVRHLQQLPDGTPGADDAQALAGRLDLAAGVEQGAQRRRVDELHAGQVEHDERAR